MMSRVPVVDANNARSPSLSGGRLQMSTDA